MEVSTRMINKYLAKGTKAAVPHLDPIRKLICKLGLHPIDAIKLAQTAGYDITLDTDTNRYLWDTIAVNRASRLAKMKTQNALVIHITTQGIVARCNDPLLLLIYFPVITMALYAAIISLAQFIKHPAHCGVILCE